MDIQIQELKQKLDAGEQFILIDVREPYEHDEFNLKGQLIPLATLGRHLEELESHKDEEIVLYCRSGARSGTAQAFLKARGFSNVRNLLGGVLAWRATYGNQPI